MIQFDEYFFRWFESWNQQLGVCDAFIFRCLFGLHPVHVFSLLFSSFTPSPADVSFNRNVETLRSWSLASGMQNWVVQVHQEQETSPSMVVRHHPILRLKSLSPSWELRTRYKDTQRARFIDLLNLNHYDYSNYHNLDDEECKSPMIHSSLDAVI